MQKNALLIVLLFVTSTAFAKIWRVNNNVGVPADFTQITTAIASAAVMAGDTIHVEPSATVYQGITLTKQLVIIGPGYFLGSNAGLQANTTGVTINGITLNNANAAGSKFFGLSFNAYISISGIATPWNLTFERCWANGIAVNFNQNVDVSPNSDGITIRKCILDYYGVSISSNATASNFTVENCIFYNQVDGAGLAKLTGDKNIFRNNSFYGGTPSVTIANAYVANNIFSRLATFTNAIVKNNLFAMAQTLPPTATGNQINVNLTNVYALGPVAPDALVQLKSGAPAIGAGVTIDGYTPDAGAFGGPDPYKLSGIPPIPTIYSLTVPHSIPTGSSTMNITFSSRNNN